MQGTRLAYVFASLNSARLALVVLSSECMIFQRAAEEHVSIVGDESCLAEEFFMKQRTFQSRLRDWHAAFIDFIKSSQEPHTNGAALLLTYHAAARIFVSTCLTRSEMIYDAYMADFQTIVEQSNSYMDATVGTAGAQPPFTFEMGAGASLFLTALKCRDRAIRQKALDLMRRAPPVQGFYKCAPGVTLAEKVSELEDAFSLTLAEDRHNVDLIGSSSAATEDGDIKNSVLNRTSDESHPNHGIDTRPHCPDRVVRIGAK
ncbi:hypothetical protein EYZ11_004662 [Aspergillus tanneri]|uniref:Uncharacterized protein n=1 Tax=Aspergillus tanneri TaxID=1220188 RepID=A0A4S3JKE2_9EURO|nr:uncharacterized protein ATNIH1004_008406 [Aspergillus tanneri]KAA8644207.1 hypothetical protein ATNIH1004_008406 [Aspergillus tanneri]THC95835.1 hypothetical protein EYZ11_004662 [Aspergillus tanneri]